MSFAQCVHDFSISYGLVFSLFLAGLVGGFTHCAGMCSPFILAQVNSEPSLQKVPSSLLLPYHFGRMTTYVLLGVLVHSVINVAFVFSGMRALITAPILMLAGVLFIVSAFPQALNIFPWVAKVRIQTPYKLIEKLSSNLMGGTGVINRYGLGILLGFMPCGLVVSALLATSTASSVGQAALAMTSFAVGTMPALVLIGLGGRALTSRYPNASARLSKSATVISGLWLFALACMMFF